jgi:hypothetical protein
LEGEESDDLLKRQTGRVHAAVRNYENAESRQQGTDLKRQPEQRRCADSKRIRAVAGRYDGQNLSGQRN